MKLLPKVSIIIVNFNGETYLDNCLRSLQDIEYSNFEIVVVDNNSTDNSLQIIDQKYPAVHVIKLENNLGFSKGNNIGANQATGEYLAFLNNDTIVDRNWLIELVKAIEICGNDAVFSSKVFLMDFPTRINTVGGRITPFGGGFDIGYGESDDEKYNSMIPVGSPAGCSMLIKKSIFINLSGFDEDYFAYFEDVDIGWRSWLAGYSVHYIPKSIVYHKGGGTAGPLNSPFRTFHGRKNRLQNITKNFSMKNLIPGIAFGIFFDSFEFMLFMIKGEGQLCKAIILGYTSFFIGINKTLKNRQIIQKHRVRSDTDLKKLTVIASYGLCIREYLRVKKLT